MKWNFYEDPNVFYEKTENLLYLNEDKNSLFLGIINQIKAGRYEHYYLALAEEGDEVLAAALMTPPHPLQLIVFTEFPDLDFELVRVLKQRDIGVSGVIGDKETVQSFADFWVAETGQTIELHMDEGLYRIDAVVKGLERSPGTWRVANKKDADLLAEWFLQFEKDAGTGASSQKEAGAKIDKFLDDKEVYIWEVDGETVSCMKKSRPSRNGITVSFVFTPQEHRRKGYARTLVAEVTEELLLEFDFVMLYTDLKNPTSNKIYSEIGYEKIANPVHLRFQSQDDKIQLIK
ncbi:GNAT family N-acetyltransferase [Planococcus beigongshangi]|uniref:GNAT family N-acetyltransferase n=1 Tax=Planococcus beigongshangi TaxID=2782536 RepID=UPI00193C5134|nr:GNAT family N-acetyltransferase [Planococcus beigongshangi]